MTENVQADIVIIGAGVIGCAVACKLSEKFNNKTIVVLESGPRLGEGVTSRNSGVIHSGIYYPPQSLKARTCIKGNSLLYEWAARKNVPFKKCGKLIVARGPGQIENLEKIYANATLSGALDIQLLNSEQALAKAEQLNVDAAIWAPWTGIIDPAALTQAFARVAQDQGVTFIYNHLVTQIETYDRNGFKVVTSKVEIQTDSVVNATGLNADEISNMIGVDRYKIYPCRGDYFSLITNEVFNTLIYPVKDPKSPGLGVHLTFDLSGQLKVGPDAEYVTSKNDFRPMESKKAVFEEATRSLLGPKINFELNYDMCGIRPKLKPPQETTERDFVISEDRAGFFNLVGIESPGLTASLAIAELVVNLF